jgi:hypothetical protein
MGNKKWLTLIFYDFRGMKKTFHKVIRAANTNFILCALCFELCYLCFVLCALCFGFKTKACGLDHRLLF